MSRHWPPRPDMSDPDVAADFERIARGGKEMRRKIAEGEAAARKLKEDLKVLAQAGARAEDLSPDDGPIVRLSRAELDVHVRDLGSGFAALAVLMRDGGYTLAVLEPHGPAVDELPTPFVAAIRDREDMPEPDGRGFDRPTVERIARAAAAVVFAEGENDDLAMLHGIAAVYWHRGSLLYVDVAPDRLGVWVDALRTISPDLVVIPAGAFAAPDVKH